MLQGKLITAKRSTTADASETISPSVHLEQHISVMSGALNCESRRTKQQSSYLLCVVHFPAG